MRPHHERHHTACEKEKELRMLGKGFLAWKQPSRGVFVSPTSATKVHRGTDVVEGHLTTSEPASTVHMVPILGLWYLTRF